MNRRQFTTSLGALSVSPALPLSAATATAAATVPPSTYAWAQLIVRAQANASPAMLARHLRISPQTAQNVFHALIRDGVLKASQSAGIVQAAKPIQTTGHHATAPQALRARLGKTIEHMNTTEPLVKGEDPEIGCGNAAQKDTANASPSEPFQESTQSG